MSRRRGLTRNKLLVARDMRLYPILSSIFINVSLPYIEASFPHLDHAVSRTREQHAVRKLQHFQIQNSSVMMGGHLHPACRLVVAALLALQKKRRDKAVNVAIVRNKVVTQYLLKVRVRRFLVHHRVAAFEILDRTYGRELCLVLG